MLESSDNFDAPIHWRVQTYLCSWIYETTKYELQKVRDEFFLYYVPDAERFVLTYGVTLREHTGAS